MELVCLSTPSFHWYSNSDTTDLSSVTTVSPPPGQHCGRVCPNSFGNRTSSSDN